MRPPRGSELGHEGIDDGGAATLHDGPAVVVRQRGEEPGKHAGERRRQRQHGVGGRAGDQGPALVGTEAPGEMLRRGESTQGEARCRQRVRRHVAHGAQEGGQDVVQIPDEGGEEPRVGGPVCSQGSGHVSHIRPDGDGAGSPREDGRRRAAASAAAHRGRRGRCQRKAGEARSSGWTAEQTSWRNPGSVSSAVRHPPPGSSAASYTSTARPARARTSAATNPLGPAPTTMASALLTGGSQPHRQASPPRP